MKWSLDTTSVHLKRILFATDLSRQATTAFKFAAWLSLRFGSKLYLVHAISSAYYAVDAGKVAPALRDVEMKVAHKKLGHYFERMREAGLVDREEIVTSSLPKELICEVVETKRVDLSRNGISWARRHWQACIGIRRGVCHPSVIYPVQSLYTGRTATAATEDSNPFSWRRTYRSVYSGPRSMQSRWRENSGHG